MGAKPAASSAAEGRYFAVDVIRVGLAWYVCLFHALSVLSWLLTTDEADALIRHPVGRIIPLGYTCVDGFLVITGMLSAEQLLRRYAGGKAPSFSELCESVFKRIFGLFLPLFTVVVGYIYFHRHGKYPIINARNESALVAMRFAATPSAEPGTVGGVVNGVPTAPSAELMRDTGAGMWPWLALGVSNMAPFGGMLEQTWSLQVQLQWYLWLPLMPFMLHFWRVITSCGRHRGTVTMNAHLLLRISMGIYIFSTVCRFIAHRHLSQFNPSSLVGFGMHFWWYASTFTRIGPLAAGAICAILSTDEFGHWKAWLTGSNPYLRSNSAARFSRAVIILMLVLNVAATAIINTFWKDLTHQDDEASPALHHELMYVLLRPGGALSAIAYSWIIFTAMHGVSWNPWALDASATKDKVDDAPSTAVDAAAQGSSTGVQTGSSDAARLRKSPSGEPTLPSPQAGSLAGSSQTLPPPRPTRFRRFIKASVPLAYMVYLVNSTVYDDLFGWTQRMHPCPPLLNAGAADQNEHLIYNGRWDRLQTASAAGSAREKSLLTEVHLAVGAVEDHITSAYTWLLQLLRGPDSLYCSQDAAGEWQCRGLCFSNERVDVSHLADAGCILTHNCTQPRVHGADIDRTAITVPATAWVQFLHYCIVGILLTWALSWALFVFVEVPLGMLLMLPGIRTLIKGVTLLHVVVLLVVSVPAHVWLNSLVLKNVTAEFEQQVNKMPFPTA